jgi:hypothetical protein
MQHASSGSRSPTNRELQIAFSTIVTARAETALADEKGQLRQPALPFTLIEPPSHLWRHQGERSCHSTPVASCPAFRKLGIRKKCSRLSPARNLRMLSRHFWRVKLGARCKISLPKRYLFVIAAKTLGLDDHVPQDFQNFF